MREKEKYRGIVLLDNKFVEPLLFS